MAQREPSMRTPPSNNSAPPPVVAPAPLADQVFETLRGWIVSGELPPGYRLRVRDVGEMVGTSMMPVREAIRRLVEAGLATHEPYKGATVRGLDTAELEQAYAVRSLLEGEAARLGAIAADESVADRMDEHYSAIETATRAGDIADAMQHDEALLDTLYAVAGNDILLDIVHGLWDKCRPYKALWIGGPDRLGHVEIWSYQPGLIAAVRANDGAEAERIVRASYENATVALREILAPDPSH